MRLPRIFTEQTIATSAHITLESGAARHLIKVLRLERGASIRLFNGRGPEFEATIDQIADGGCVVIAGAPVERKTESPLNLTLAQGIARGEKMDLILQKATELGVSRIIPVLMNRSMVKLSGQRLEKRMMHWQGVVVGACEQCGRTRVPEVAAPVNSATLIESKDKSPLSLILNPAGDQVIDTLPEQARDVLLWVGPEGGFSSAEREDAIANGFGGLRMGPRILRTETAGLVAISLLQARFGDLA